MKTLWTVEGLHILRMLTVIRILSAVAVSFAAQPTSKGSATCQKSVGM